MKYILQLCFLLLIVPACQPPAPKLKSPTIEKRYVQPTNGYAQMAVITHGKMKRLHISGQIGPGNTLEEQMRGALAAIKELLTSEGATYSDLVKINSYIVDYQPEDLDVFRGVRESIFGSEITPASTLVGVSALALPEWLIEIDAEAVVVIE
ncbi:MAG: RidA family protein [Cyclobacteriaceae bacterium]